MLSGHERFSDAVQLPLVVPGMNLDELVPSHRIEQAHTGMFLLLGFRCPWRCGRDGFKLFPELPDQFPGLCAADLDNVVFKTVGHFITPGETAKKKNQPDQEMQGCI
jgi:hypothetical protein